MEKIKVLLLGDNEVAAYARNKLKDCEVLVIGDSAESPKIPDSFRPNAAFSIKFPHILKKSFIDRVCVPILNFHTAPLPELRGVDTTSWAIVDGLDSFGVTVHIIDERVDTGPIVLKETFPITPFDTAYSLYCKNLVLLVKIIDKEMTNLVKGKYRIQKFKSKVSHFHKKKEFDYTDLEVNLDQPIDKVDRFIRSRIFPGRQLPHLKNGKKIIGCRIKDEELVLKYVK